MPTLSCFFAIFADGKPIRTELQAPRGARVLFSPLATPQITNDDELYGPHASLFRRAKLGTGTLLAITRETHTNAGAFFAEAQKTLMECVRSRQGWLLDVHRLVPTPLVHVDELHEDPFAEDLISLALHDHGAHGFTAESVGLARFGQKEVSFSFDDAELTDDAHQFVCRIADYAMSSGRRIAHGQTMSFGFDRVKFTAVEGDDTNGAFRGWHAPLIQRVLSAELFPGTGVLKAWHYPSIEDTVVPDLSAAFRRALEQRTVLEEADVAGDCPHQSSQAYACACAGGSNGLRGRRDEPQTQKDSGWTFTCNNPHPSSDLGVSTLGQLARRLPQILRYLALPAGCSVVWTPGGVMVDAAAAHTAETDDDESDASLG